MSASLPQWRRVAFLAVSPSMPKAFRLLFLPITALSLLMFGTACDQKFAAEQLLFDYQARMVSLTGIETPVAELPPLVQWPNKRDRLLVVPERRTSISEWFRLRDCELFVLINERNSILGRVQQPSQRLLYEVRFIQLSERCVEKLDARIAKSPSPQLINTRNKLVVTLVDKRHALLAVLWNSSIASDEFSAFVRLSAEPLSPGNDSAASVAVTALSQWRAVQQLALGGGVLPAREYENANKALGQSRWLGQLYRGQRLAIQSLHGVAEVLERRLEQPLCFNGQPNRKSRAFNNVFQRYYAGGIQPYLAQLKNQQRQFSEILDALLSPFGLQPQPVQAWFQYHQKDLQHQFDAAIARHANAWKSLLGQCGLMPGVDGV